MQKKSMVAAWLAAAAVAACLVQPLRNVSRLEVARASADVGQLAADLAGVRAEFASRGTHGRHLGFDTYRYPGDETMLAWRSADVPFEWVGYYLPAPCHKGDTWVGKRERLERMGWGLAVIYVGQQTWDRTRTPTTAQVRAAERSGATCSAALVTRVRGGAEASDAIARTADEGFADGTTIFLDVERMERTPQHMRDYYREWVRGVLRDGRYRPGVYVHTHNAERIYADVKAVYEAEGHGDEEPPFWVASGRDFHPSKAPTDVGHAFAAVWQGLLDISQTWNGIELPIDVNVAASPSPSAPDRDWLVRRVARLEAARSAELGRMAAEAVVAE